MQAEHRGNGHFTPILGCCSSFSLCFPCHSQASSDVHVYNALIDIAIYRRRVGTAEEALAEMDAHHVKPNAETLALLLQTYTDEQWKAGQPMRLMNEVFWRRYGVARNWKAALIAVKALGRVGSLQQCQDLFARTPELQGRRDAWMALVQAHAQHGNVSDAAALLSSMARAGQIPDVSFVNVVLRAAAGTKSHASVAEHLLEKSCVSRLVLFSSSLFAD